MATPNGEQEVSLAKPSRRRIVIPILIGLAVVILLIGIPYLIYASRHVSTDDAQIDGNITTIAPRVKGQVTAIYVDDNSTVHRGDVLLRLDDRDLRAAAQQAAATYAQALASHSAADISVPQQAQLTSAQIAQADAGIGQGQSGITTAQAALQAAQAQLNAAQANLVKATKDEARARQLVAQGAIAQADADSALNAYQAALSSRDSAAQGVRQAQAGLQRAEAQLAANDAELQQAQAGVDTTKIKAAQARTSAAQVLAAKAELDDANLQLSYATIKAPVDGVVSKRSVNVGDFVNPGQALMAVVDEQNIWITANLKETQMTNVRIGQPATIKVDAYPHQKFRGTVESIAPATGSTFALIPPDNATGNYTKVVQRVPVRFKIDQTSDPSHLLRQGLSVEVTIDTSNH
ncbi:MAG: HlyD family secretion protein [Candidatus Eremiobacteraeota bacterium]|nr:HlyD family secretion protein [Candidatus Eremiobacteraeota bacterium]MBV8221789.1 HlyD family secretion protein [Candidatus Eremiobacteraeota bacterium]